jgi:hypothetical protein
MSNETKLVYIGDEYYSQSKTIMSPIYTEEGQRYDWGFVTIDLAKGKAVTIRQANAVERRYYEQRLAAIKAEA